MSNEKIEVTPEEMEIARLAIEDMLILRRDARLSVVDAGNGLCVREKDGTIGGVIRLTVHDALKIAIRAINESRNA